MVVGAYRQGKSVVWVFYAPNKRKWTPLSLSLSLNVLVTGIRGDKTFA